MPVTRYFLRAAMVAMGVALAALPAQSARVTTTKRLTNSMPVQQAFELFDAVSAATVFFDECRDPYALDDHQQTYVRTLYYDAGAKVTQAYATEYERVVGTPPDEAAVASYVQAIRDRQQVEAGNALKLVRGGQGCAHPVIGNMINYIHRYEKTYPLQTLHYAPVHETAKPLEPAATGVITDAPANESLPAN